MSTRIIIALETFAVVILAVIVVIYAQVIWQRIQTAKPVTSVEPSLDGEQVTGTPELTPDEKMRVLASLKQAATANGATAAEKTATLHDLNSVEESHTQSVEEKTEMLKKLAQ